MKKEIDKFHHLACIQKENQNSVAYDCRDVAIRVVLKKMQQKCDIGGQNSNYEYTNETYAIYLWKHCIFRIQ